MYRYLKNLPFELSVANCMSVDTSFIMEKSWHKNSGNFSSDEIICSWFISAFFQNQGWVWGIEKRSKTNLPNWWWSLWSRGNHGWSFERWLMPKSDHTTLLYFSLKVYFPLVKTIARWLFDLTFELQEKKCRDLVNFWKIPSVKNS